MHRNNSKSRNKHTLKIPEREELLEYLSVLNKPRTLEKMAADHGLRTSEERKALRKRLRAMQRDGQIIKNRKEGYGLVEKMDLLTGVVLGHPDGFGFVKLDKGGKDLFLSPKEMRKVLHGDRIVVRMMGYDRRGRPEGSIVDVLTRANQQVVGRYHEEGKVGFVIPENRKIHQDILITPGKKSKVRPGEIVVVEITHQPDRHTQPVGKISRVLGTHMTAALAVDIAVHSFGIPAEWPEAVLHESEQISPEVTLTDTDNREDIRGLPLVTIDGEDARDFDDAVYCEPQGNGWRLIVAIADVSNYVTPKSALDQEAWQRGNSVYFPQSVIPMLPKVLSNGLCSLKPKTDRLCVVCELNVDAQGKVKRYRFFQAIMHSAARLTYTEVAAMLVDRDKAVLKRYKSLNQALEHLYDLYQIMHAYRQSKALLDFDELEPRFEFNAEGNIESIHAMQRNDAHRLIEEFMLAANVAAAEFLLEHEIPALFRVHDKPKLEKLEALHSLLGEWGLSLGGGDEPTARHYAKLLDQVRQRDDAHMIETVLLRSMPLAVYSEENIGHFGLGFPAYTHFTSPIRRYPDLLVHRAIKKIILGQRDEYYPYSRQHIHEAGDNCSMTERRADEAVRDVIQWYKCEYMSGKIGEQFVGTISSVTSFGFFVELDEIFIEGLVHITSLPIDYYHFDDVGHQLVGERTGSSYRLSNRVRVKLVRVSMDDRKIDFELIESL